MDGEIEKGHRERERWVGEKGDEDGYLGRTRCGGVRKRRREDEMGN